MKIVNVGSNVLVIKNIKGKVVDVKPFEVVEVSDEIGKKFLKIYKVKEITEDKKEEEKKEKAEKGSEDKKEEKGKSK